MIVNALYNIVDRMFIGNIPNIGSLAIQALVTMPIMTIILAFGMLIGIGATANISLNLGKGNRPTAEKLLGNAFTLSIIVGLAIAIVGTICANPILNLFGASENTLFYAKEYLNIILLGCTFNILSFSLNSTVRADGNPKMSSLTMVIGCGTNIILDYVFIFIFNLELRSCPSNYYFSSNYFLYNFILLHNW